MALQRLGIVPWETLRADLCATDSHCAWSDFAGFHFAPATSLPDRIPPTTHLWAWDATRAVRARIDVDRTLVAVLHNDAPTDPPTEEVNVHERVGRPWSTADPHVGKPERPLPQSEFTLLELAGSPRAVFIRSHPDA